MHVDKPKTKTWPCNEQAPPHLFLDLLKQLEHPRSSLPLCFPRVHKSEFLTNFAHFSLKESARNSLMTLLSNPWVHTLKDSKTPSHFSSHSLKETIRPKKLSPSFIPMSPTPKERKLS